LRDWKRIKMTRNRTITLPPDIADRIAAILEATAEDAKLAFVGNPKDYTCVGVEETCNEMIYVARKLRGSERRPTLPDTPIAKLRAIEAPTERIEKVDITLPGELGDFDDEPITLVESPMTMETLIRKGIIAGR
jgi:hypothetical protein